VQLVEIPGLISGAVQGRGGGRALLGVVRGADAIAFCHDVRAPLADLHQVRAEVANAGIVKPSLLALTKVDEADAATFDRILGEVPDLATVGVSVLDDGSLDAFREAAWQLTGLLRVFTRRHGSEEADPLALPTGATVGDVAGALHRELAEAFEGARVWGSSVRFAGQRVGRDHPVADGDIVEVIT
jgi:ribosome-interacting GTPase 1